MIRRWWYIIGSVAALGLIAISVLLIAPKSPVPNQIKRQLTSTLLMPKHPDVKIDRESVKYESNLKLLSFTATVFGKPAVFSEQPTPESFSDIPQVYDKVLVQMGEYSKFDVDVGTVHLTRPTDLKGKQAAVLNTKGTLMFIKPESDLADDEWRRLMGSLVVEK